MPSVYHVIIISYLITLTIFGYIIMWYDKKQAIKKQYRIPEKQLFLIALMLGALGIYLGMKTPIYHKANKTLFKIGIPVLIICNAIMVFVIWNSI